MSSNNASSQNKETVTQSNPSIDAKVTQHSNVDQDHITIPEDRVKLILLDHLKKIEDKKLWRTPLNMLVSSVAMQVATEKFKPFFFVSPESLETIVYLVILVSFGWCLINLHKVYKNRGASIDDIIRAMKKTDRES